MIPEKRVSSYIIKVSVEAGKVMLLHGYSGAIDVVDISVADLLCEGRAHLQGQRLVRHHAEDLPPAEYGRRGQADPPV